jgi:hypothetical protein
MSGNLTVQQSREQPLSESSKAGQRYDWSAFEARVT